MPEILDKFMFRHTIFQKHTFYKSSSLGFFDSIHLQV